MSTLSGTHEIRKNSISRLVLAYDLLEDRRRIDVIIKRFFPLCFKLAEIFENLYDVLRDWKKEKIQESLVDVMNRC